MPLRKSFKSKKIACSADLEAINDHVSDVFSFQESIVLLCPLLFHVDVLMSIVVVWTLCVCECC